MPNPYRNISVTHDQAKLDIPAVDCWGRIRVNPDVFQPTDRPRQWQPPDALRPPYRAGTVRHQDRDRPGHEPRGLARLCRPRSFVEAVRRGELDIDTAVERVPRE